MKSWGEKFWKQILDKKSLNLERKIREENKEFEKIIELKIS